MSYCYAARQEIESHHVVLVDDCFVLCNFGKRQWLWQGSQSLHFISYAICNAFERLSFSSPHQTQLSSSILKELGKRNTVILKPDNIIKLAEVQFELIDRLFYLGKIRLEGFKNSCQQKATIRIDQVSIDGRFDEILDFILCEIAHDEVRRARRSCPWRDVTREV